jgi:beta-glucuronidase
MISALALVTTLCAGARQEPLDLNGSWEFAFAEGKIVETAGDPDFAATDRMSVPGCWDMLPKWLCKRGTGLYRRTFTLAEPVENAWIVVDGMGLRAQFAVDGKPVGGIQPFPWAQLEIPTGPLAAGTHTIFAALDNVLEWSTQKLALPYYDFYLYGGFYHGVKMVFDNRKLFVRTRDYRTGTVEIEAVNFARGDFDATLVFDGAKEVKTSFRNFRTTVRVPDFKLWSPSSPNLHTVALANHETRTTSHETRFGIREIKAEKKRLWLNGEILFLKGANRHEAHPQFGAATPEALMVQDIQLLKSINGNFFRGCHYQQSQRFLDYCDEMGVLVWEESLGWGNNAKQMGDPEYFRLQVEQTRAMVRASFNHPSVIIFAFQNENASQTKEGKKMNDALIDAIRSQDSGRLITFACNHNNDDISNEKTDLISFNTYPGWIGSDAGTFENQKQLIDAAVTKIIARYRKLYPEKPIIVSEMGTTAIYGHHDPAAGQGTEEFQLYYNKDVLDRIFADPEMAGLTFWHFADARTYHRGGSNIRAKLLAENMAGIYDGYRRAKIVTVAIKEGFARAAAGESPAK